jgi:NADH-quinone oxidoreductase subunit L
LREIRWLRSFMDMEQLSWLDSANVSQWHQRPLVAGVHGWATRVGLGWLTSFLGHLALLLLLVLSSPLLLGKFVSPYKLSAHKFYFDELYRYTIVLPLRGLAQLCYAVDRWAIDGMVNLIGWIPPAVGTLMRSLQMGLLQFYALAMFLGVLVLIATKLIWGTG